MPNTRLLNISYFLKGVDIGFILDDFLMLFDVLCSTLQHQMGTRTTRKDTKRMLLEK